MYAFLSPQLETVKPFSRQKGRKVVLNRAAFGEIKIAKKNIISEGQTCIQSTYLGHTEPMRAHWQPFFIGSFHRIQYER